MDVGRVLGYAVLVVALGWLSYRLVTQAPRVARDLANMVPLTVQMFAEIVRKEPGSGSRPEHWVWMLLGAITVVMVSVAGLVLVMSLFVSPS